MEKIENSVNDPHPPTIRDGRVYKKTKVSVCKRWLKLSNNCFFINDIEIRIQGHYKGGRLVRGVIG